MNACDRIWEVEAARDGRLSDQEAARAAQHRGGCAACAAEHQGLEDLGRALRETRPSVDDLAVRRLRHAVMGRASRPESPAASRSRRGLWAGATAAVAAALVVFAIGFGTQPATRSEADVQIDAMEGGIVTRLHEAGVDRMVLSAGRFAIDVKEQAPGRRLLFMLPDGELEDVGTRFEVTVQEGRTRRVVVHEGAVVLRRSGHEEVRLDAGATWAAPEDAMVPAVEAPPRVVAEADVVPSDAAAIRAPSAADPSKQPAEGPVGAGVGERAAPPPSRPVGSPPAPLGAPTASAAAVASAVPATSSSPADHALDDVASEIAALAEDEAYLKVVALLREGREEEARVAARSYLRRFPEGLRRVEVQAIAR